MLSLIFRLSLALCLFGAAAWAEEPNLSFIHLPIMQGATSATEVQFNILAPRLNKLSIKVVLGKQRIDGELITGPISDFKNEEHEVVYKFRVRGLKPGTEYRLEIYNQGMFQPELTDTRLFKTLDEKLSSVRFAVVSCMSDDREFEDVRTKIWPKLVSQKPDYVFLIGDQTYVDSFDYVTRGTATDQDMWRRYARAFSENPYFRSERLFPTAVAIDDHDTGIDNGHKDTPTIATAAKLMNIFYGSGDIPGAFENAPEGLAKLVTLGTQKFFVLDNRTSRTAYPDDSRYGHLGQAQEEWLLRSLSSDGFNHLLLGDMWGSPAQTVPRRNGSPKRITEGFFADHPTQYRALMDSIHGTNSLYALYSGDIHFSQIIEHGPLFEGSARFSPFATAEFTSSPMHSLIFGAKPGEEIVWRDLERIVYSKEYNFMIVQAQNTARGWNVQATSIGLQEKPLFQREMFVNSKADPDSKRRMILNDHFGVFEGNKVNVAIFDADDTLRTALSGRVTAQDRNDVLILPRVADKIAELAAKGYFIAIASNQGGVKLGLTTVEEADAALRKTIELIQEQNPKAVIHYYDFAEYGPDDYYTKPNPGMGKHLIRVLRRQGYEMDPTRSLMVGDAQYRRGVIDPQDRVGDGFSDSDRLFADRLGIRPNGAADFFGWTEEERRAIARHNFDYIRKVTCPAQLTFEFAKPKPI